MKQVTLAIVGCGARGANYGKFALEFPKRAKVVAIAEPRQAYREIMVSQHNVQKDRTFQDWQSFFQEAKMADAVVIATQDNDHIGPALAAFDKGYDVLLEKPMAPTLEQCETIVRRAKSAGRIFSVCHVLRYTNYTRKIKELIDKGAIGEVVCVQRLEPVGFWHQAHSYVRGNWRNEASSSSMLLAKSCHDLDWLRHIVGAPCLSLSSFGSLKHFKTEEAPEGSAARCLDCAVEATCPYSAKKIYLDRVAAGETEWPALVLHHEPTLASIEEALRTGPYGRCVYRCDNDVVDHQVLACQFAKGRTATFTMTAFTSFRGRNTRIFGTAGEICGDGEKIELFDFLSRQWKEVATDPLPETSLRGHGGGDYGLMDSFISASAKADQSLVLSGPAESLETHAMVFAAEKARLENRVVELSDL